jgi:putative tryptophan/tyrosine transport system substrate-binding protein
MTRVLSVIVLLVAGLFAPLVVEAQQAGKVYRIGFLSPAAPEPPGMYDSRRNLTDVLRERGYVEGRNLAVERRYADGRVERLPALAAELVQRHVDVVVTMSPVAFRAARDATKTIPIVFLLAGSDPVELGFVPSVHRRDP